MTDVVSRLDKRRHLEHSHGVRPTSALQAMTVEQLDRIHAVFHEVFTPHVVREQPKVYVPIQDPPLRVGYWPVFVPRGGHA